MSDRTADVDGALPTQLPGDGPVDGCAAHHGAEVVAGSGLCALCLALERLELALAVAPASIRSAVATLRHEAAVLMDPADFGQILDALLEVVQVEH